MRVYVNYIDREILDVSRLTANELNRLDLSRKECEDNGLRFFKYRREYYRLDDFMSNHMMVTDSKTNKTVEIDGIMNWSWSNGLAVKIGDSGDSVRAYYFYSNSSI